MSMQGPREHLFAILRVAPGVCAEGAFNENRLTVSKLVRTIERAREEVGRLNTLNGPKGSRYFFQVTRLEPEDASRASNEEGPGDQ